MDFSKFLDMPGVSQAVMYTAQHALRYIINGMIEPVKPADLLKAIRDGTSLWSMCGGQIKDTANMKIPDEVMGNSSKFVTMVNAAHGGFTPLTLKWLATDRPELFSLIINTEGGIEWLDKNVYEILKGVGIDAPRPTDAAIQSS